VLSLEPSEYLTQNEIAAAALADQGEAFNPQQQFPVTWPADPIVAKAYIDQLKRADFMTDESANALTQVLNRAANSISEGAQNSGLASELSDLAKALELRNRSDTASLQQAGLAETLTGIASRLQ